jgi:phage gp36-like protein
MSRPWPAIQYSTIHSRAVEYDVVNLSLLCAAAAAVVDGKYWYRYLLSCVVVYYVLVRTTCSIMGARYCTSMILYR